MATNKTTETSLSVIDFINSVKDETKRNDCFSLIELLKKQTGFDPKMWGPSIVGFGSYHYKYESGREGDSLIVGFSPRATTISLYLSGSFEKREELLEKLGKHKTDKGCIHIKKLADINMEVLLQMIVNHLEYMQKMYPK
ncbi:hypothetical protein EMA8858_02437 [Emticicia aquatica]|jgi:hypothetical protein|uniref:YdhG-like domain-containing protein n=1 Tax=Emticicia aquatica TaxID=1681835 RepID=A0ABN8EWG3_9BACT|nr:DUF1801 domain-containing protein [Emticicia aquatica]CAH0996306.1 hypothetical protein EMA8858_02437 [Emticicia aquatica]